jgi:hypothetical protein
VKGKRHFTLLYPWQKNVHYSLDRRQGGDWSQFGCRRKERNLLCPPGIKSWSSACKITYIFNFSWRTTLFDNINSIYVSWKHSKFSIKGTWNLAFAILYLFLVYLTSWPLTSI